MRKKICILILLGITLTSWAYGYQDNRSVIKGKITDINGVPLPGTGITITNTFLGVSAAADGSYSIPDLKDGNYSVRFSFIGYETQIHEVILSGEAILNVIMVQKTMLTEEVIVNATRAGAHTPLAYTNVEYETLKRQNSGQDLPYLLSLTPSLVETSEAGNGIGYTNLRIRGTDASRINVTIDGIPLNDPESQQVFWVDLPDLASSVENIQVQRGVGTSSNGAGAFGASINIQTRSPENEPFAEISSSTGSFSTLKNMVAAGTGLLAGRFAIQMRYSDLKSSGFIERTGSNHRSAYISGVFRTEKSRIKANIILGEEHTGIGWWGVPEDMLKVNRRYNPAGEYTDENGNTQYYDNESDNYFQNHYQLIYSHRQNSNLSFHSALHYTKGKGYYEEYKEERSLEDYGLPFITTGGTMITESDLIRRKWMNNDFYGLVWSLNYRKEKTEAKFGGGMNHYSGDHFGRIIWMRYPGNTEKDHQWYLNNGSKSEMSLYGKINYSLSERTSIFGDLQYRYIRYRMTGNDDDLKDLSQKHHFNFFNPKAGIFFSITPNQDAYFSFSVANREPARTDFKEAAGDADATPKHETLFDPEMGYKLRTGKSSLAVNFYGMIYKDQLVPTGELSNVGYPIMTNVDRSYRLGAEFSAGFMPFNYLEWNFNITLSRNKIIDFTEHYIDYNTSDWSSEYKSKKLGAVDIAYSPSLTGSSDLAVKIAPVIKMHLISKFVGRQYFDNTMNSERMLGPYFINNIRIDFEPEIRNTRSTGLSLLVNNIFNAKYESNAYGGNWYEDGVEKSWAYYFPQAGIHFIVKLDVKF
ncbi:MAG TPA: TonB-dependent receptor [Bacteroidales bacterium]|nr:TonB-dependent receptor [Bacteroidales bacterium]